MRLSVPTRTYADHNFKRAWRRRQKGKHPLKCDRRFEKDLSAHWAILSISAREEGSGEICTQCDEPIYGLLRHSIAGRPLNWACAGCPKPMSRDVRTSSDGKVEQALASNLRHALFKLRASTLQKERRNRANMCRDSCTSLGPCGAVMAETSGEFSAASCVLASIRVG